MWCRERKFNMKPSVKLTDKQEKFVLGLIEGKSQRQAFKDAGYSTKGKSENVVDRNASVLAKNTKVSQRYEELRAQVAEESKWTRQKAFEEYEWLKNVAKSEIEVAGVKKATADAFVSGLDGMNKMALGNDQLVNKKIEKEIALLDEKVKSLKGTEKDTSLMNVLIDAVTDDE